MEQNAYFGDAGFRAAPLRSSGAVTARPAPPLPPGAQPGRHRRRPVAGRTVAVLVVGLLAVLALGYSLLGGHSGKSSSQSDAGVRADVVTIGGFISNYYTGHTDPVTVVLRGSLWVVLNVDGSLVGSGHLANNETLLASSLTEPGSWCIAIGGSQAGSPAWTDSAASGVQSGRSCG